MANNNNPWAKGGLSRQYERIRPQPPRVVRDVDQPFNQPTPRLGELLTQASLVSAEQVNDALFAAIRVHERIGAVLVRRGYITLRTLESALQMQTLLAQGAVTSDIAIMTLQNTASGAR